MEEVQKKTMLEMFGVVDAACNGYVAHRKKWADNNPEKVRELSRKYGEEHKEEKESTQSRI